MKQPLKHELNILDVFVYAGDTTAILIAAAILLVIGLFGITMNRGSLLKIIMSLELSLLSININFIMMSVYLDDIAGFAFVMFVLGMSAAESAIGLAVLAVYYDKTSSAQPDVIKSKSRNLKLRFKNDN